ncbi:MAG: hypothetical protein SCH39_10145 [Methanosarcinales archaeon]|nr:hypothetical protein [ANME-2 cluster archaeon]MDF1532596.1 hypothetical protein [ANME-2 cluster archaeon]MDW7776676.1 hypothetical protein [Methanosarcinales archaeon]
MGNIQNAEQLVEAIEGARSNALIILGEMEQTNEVRTLKNKVETCDDPHVLFLTVKEVLQLVVSRHSNISKPHSPKQYI